MCEFKLQLILYHSCDDPTMMLLAVRMQQEGWRIRPTVQHRYGLASLPASGGLTSPLVRKYLGMPL